MASSASRVRRSRAHPTPRSRRVGASERRQRASLPFRSARPRRRGEAHASGLRGLARRARDHDLPPRDAARVLRAPAHGERTVRGRDPILGARSPRRGAPLHAHSDGAATRRRRRADPRRAARVACVGRLLVRRRRDGRRVRRHVLSSRRRVAVRRAPDELRGLQGRRVPADRRDPATGPSARDDGTRR